MIVHHKLAVYAAVAAGLQHQDAIGRRRGGNAGVLVAVSYRAIDRAQPLHLRPAAPGLLVDVFLDLSAAPALTAQHFSVPVAHDPEPGSIVQVDAQPVAGHGVGGGVHQALGGDAVAVAQHLRVLDGCNSDRGLVGVESSGDVERLPRAAFLVLTDTDAELRQGTHASPVENVGPLLEHVNQDEPDGAPDGGVGPMAGAEQVASAVKLDFVADGTIDQYQDAR